jgi:basic membrane protein A
LRHATKIAALVGATALLLAGCGSKPSDNSSNGSSAGSGSSGGASAGKQFKACMVLDVGGVDDRSFNQSSWAGMQAAKKANSNIAISYVSSSSQNDYTPNLTAETNKSGTVATFGGLNIPPVTIYMDGFWEGVQYYNQQKKKSVKVLGWDEKNQKGGTFANSFTDLNKGKSISQAFIQSGADIVFPVAGGTGLGAGAAAQASGGKVSVIWVDTDGCISASQYCKYFLTSVTKNLTDPVTQYVTKSANGSFPTGNYTGDLSNGGTGLAPFHDFDSKVPSSVKSELDTIKKDIASGKIKITSPSQPQ